MKEHSTRDLTWGVLFLCAGAVLLLNNFGVVDSGVWRELARWWPVLLIAVGIRIIFHRTSAWYLGYLGPILIVATVAWVVYSYSPTVKGEIDYLGKHARRSSASVRTFKKEVAADPSVKTVDAVLSVAAGDLKLSAGNAKKIFSADVSYAGEPPTFTSSSAGGGARIEMKDSLGRHDFPLPGRTKVAWDVSLTPALPVTLECSLGAGNADIDLSRIRATKVTVAAGAGNVTVKMPENVDKTTAEVSAGAGNLTVRVPRGVGLHVTGSAGVGTIDLSAVGGGKSGGVARSLDFSTPDYAKAAKRMDITVKAGAGTITFTTE